MQMKYVVIFREGEEIRCKDLGFLNIFLECSYCISIRLFIFGLFYENGIKVLFNLGQ